MYEEEQAPTCGPGLAEGLPPFSDNSFSFTSLMATITLLSACAERLHMDSLLICARPCTLHTLTFSSSFGRKRAPRLLAFPPFCMAVQDSAEKINVGKFLKQRVVWFDSHRGFSSPSSPFHLSCAHLAAGSPRTSLASQLCPAILPLPASLSQPQSRT